MRTERSDRHQLLGMFLSFFRIGAFTIGGGYAMLPLIEREFVVERKWVTPEEIVDIFAIVQSVPGVIAINTSIFIGYKVRGPLGAVIAAAGMILPSFFIILLVAALLVGFQENPYVQRAFGGVRAGVTALILLAAVKLGKAVMKSRLAVAVAVLSFVAIVLFDIHAIWIILSAGVLGYLLYGIRKAAAR